LLVAAGLITTEFGVVDDAWITYAYARNLAQGHGIAFNPGEIVEGCTAFLHMVLLAPFSLLTERLDRVAVALNVLAWAGVAALAWTFIRRRDGGQVGALGWLAMAFILLGLSGLAWTYSGMEMPVVALAWLGAVKLHLGERDAGRLPWASALATVAAGLLRPDGILVAPTIALSVWLKAPKRFDWRNAAVYCALVLGLFGGYWLWRWHYFGWLLPNTFYAKVATTSLALTWSGVKYLLRWMFGMVVPLAGLVALLLARGVLAAPRWVKLMLALTATSMLYVLLVGADFFSFHRFLLPSYTPMVLAAWWFGVRALAKRRGGRASATSRRKKLVIAGVVFLLCETVYWVGRIPPQGLVHGFIVDNTKDWALVARKLPQTTPPDAKIATVPIGAMGYFSHRYILDLVGLTDVHIAHAHAPTGLLITGHEKYDIDYVMARRPELIISWPGVMPAGVDGLHKWIMSNIGTEAQKRLMTDPRTPREYRFAWMLLSERIPIRRGSLERWQSLQNRQWAGVQWGKGVIALLRRDLVGTPEYAAFAPMGDSEAAWLWHAFGAATPEDLFRRILDMRRGAPPPPLPS
jgi:hypothetical protein